MCTIKYTDENGVSKEYFSDDVKIIHHFKLGVHESGIRRSERISYNSKGFSSDIFPKEIE